MDIEITFEEFCESDLQLPNYTVFATYQASIYQIGMCSVLTRMVSNGKKVGSF